MMFFYSKGSLSIKRLNVLFYCNVSHPILHSLVLSFKNSFFLFNYHHGLNRSCVHLSPYFLNPFFYLPPDLALCLCYFKLSISVSIFLLLLLFLFLFSLPFSFSPPFPSLTHTHTHTSCNRHKSTLTCLSPCPSPCPPQYG